MTCIYCFLLGALKKKLASLTFGQMFSCGQMFSFIEKYSAMCCHHIASLAGHGGPNAADYVRGNIFNNLMMNAKFPSDMHGAIMDAYHTTDEQYMNQDAGSQREDG
jgi:hypothetical protein